MLTENVVRSLSHCGQCSRAAQYRRRKRRGGLLARAPERLDRVVEFGREFVEDVEGEVVGGDEDAVAGVGHPE